MLECRGPPCTTGSLARLVRPRIHRRNHVLRLTHGCLRQDARQLHASLCVHAELGPRIGITCQVVLELVYFVLVIRTFRNCGEVGRNARVVQRP
jgi:hypothetical protein